MKSKVERTELKNHFSKQLRNLYELPADLPKPIDDGGTDHLLGMKVPNFLLESTNGSLWTSAAFEAPSVLFIYPRAGSPLEPNPNQELWDLTPGARGCTPQSCGFRDHYQRFLDLGVSVYGLSHQEPHIQREFVERNRIKFPILSDHQYKFATALSLPTFNFENERLIKRMALYLDQEIIKKVFYPVFPPDKNAEEIMLWLRRNGT